MMGNLEINAWHILGKEFAKIDSRKSSKFLTTSDYCSKDFLDKNDFYEIANFVKENCKEVNLDNAIKAFENESIDSYLAKQQMLIFFTGTLS